MSFTEHALQWSCQGDTAVGIVSRPLHPFAQGQLGVVILVGGPQYRAGSHRQFVLLARHLAVSGIPAFRFDVRGMGDSTGQPRSFEQLDDDIAAGIDEFQRALPELKRVALVGLCDAASAALLYLGNRPDSRVDGLVLLNPWVRNAHLRARAEAKHYYVARLRQREFWTKLLQGKVGVDAVTGLFRRLAHLVRPASTISGGPSAPTSFQDRMLTAWARYQKPVLLALSGNDLVARECADLLTEKATVQKFGNLLTRPSTELHEAKSADHTFSSVAEEKLIEQRISDWIRQLA